MHCTQTHKHSRAIFINDISIVLPNKRAIQIIYLFAILCLYLCFFAFNRIQYHKQTNRIRWIYFVCFKFTISWMLACAHSMMMANAFKYCNKFATNGESRGERDKRGRERGRGRVWRILNKFYNTRWTSQVVSEYTFVFELMEWMDVCHGWNAEKWHVISPQVKWSKVQ